MTLTAKHVECAQVCRAAINRFYAAPDWPRRQRRLSALIFRSPVPGLRTMGLSR